MAMPLAIPGTRFARAIPIDPKMTASTPSRLTRSPGWESTTGERRRFLRPRQLCRCHWTDEPQRCTAGGARSQAEEEGVAGAAAVVVAASWPFRYARHSTHALQEDKPLASAVLATQSGPIVLVVGHRERLSAETKACLYAGEPIPTIALSTRTRGTEQPRCIIPAGERLTT